MNLWIVRYYHRHGADCFPVYKCQRPTLEWLLKNATFFAEQFEKREDEGVEIYGPFDLQKGKYAIQNTNNPELWWSHEIGWVDRTSCDNYQDQNYSLPMEGKWVNLEYEHINETVNS